MLGCVSEREERGSGHGSDHLAGVAESLGHGRLDYRGCAPSVEKEIYKRSCHETVLNGPLQEDQASTFGDEEQGGVLRDEVTRDDILGRRIVLVPLEAVRRQGKVGWTTFFLTPGRRIKLCRAHVYTRVEGQILILTAPAPLIDYYPLPSLAYTVLLCRGTAIMPRPQTTPN